MDKLFVPLIIIISVANTAGVVWLFLRLGGKKQGEGPLKKNPTTRLPQPLPAPPRDSDTALIPLPTSLPCPVPDNRVPRITIYFGVLAEIARRTQRHRQEHPNTEIIFTLLGTARRMLSGQLITIQGFIEAGPRAILTPVSAILDVDYQQGVLAYLQSSYPGLEMLGNCHLHPGAFDHCSETDRVSDSAFARYSEPGMIAIIMIKEPSQENGRKMPGTLRIDGIKFSFYFMSKDTEYRYVRFEPVLLEGPVITIPSTLDALAAADPIRFRLEFHGIRHLCEYDIHFGELSLEQSTPTPSVILTSQFGYRIIFLYPGPLLRHRRVLIDLADGVCEWHAARDADGHILSLTHTVFQIEHALRNSNRVHPPRSSDLAPACQP